MKHTLSDDVLTLYPIGSISSATAGALENDIFSIIADKAFKQLVLDLSDVDYVSSAGLRVMLKLIQKYRNFKVIGVSLEVYDVFEMTGFTQLMQVEKRLVCVDVSNAKLIGEGYFSQVYRIDKDTIIKVFRRNTNIEDVRRELNLAKQAFVLGIPTAISFDVVKVGERFGVRFEMLDCASLRDVFRDQPNRYDEMIHKYAALLKTINTTESTDETLPDAKEEWLKKLEVIRQYLSEEEHDKLLHLADTIQDCKTFVHGDCHFKNIMVQGEELLLIDMDTLSKGNPIFELAAIYAPYVAFEESEPGNSQRFFNLPASFIQPMFRDVLDIYFGKHDDAAFKKIGLVSYVHMVWWNDMNEKDNLKRHNDCLARVKSLLNELDDLNIF